MAVLNDLEDVIKLLYNDTKRNNKYFLVVPILYILSTKMQKSSYAYISKTIQKSFKERVDKVYSSNSLTISDKTILEMYKELFMDDLSNHRNRSDSNSRYDSSHAFSPLFRVGEKSISIVQPILTKYVDYIEEKEINRSLGVKKKGDKKLLYRIKPEYYEAVSETLKAFVENETDSGDIVFNEKIRDMIDTHIKLKQKEQKDVDVSSHKIKTTSTHNEIPVGCFNRIYYGPPGTGKTYTITKLLEKHYPSRFTFVTFHQSYGYEEFIEGLRPVLSSDSEHAAQGGHVQYEIRPGAFKRLCDRAREDRTERFAMVIDEINRGNISKIFGELITLIEPDKRDLLDGSTPPIELTLPYSDKPFSVPYNIDIIGTMNTADRSLALLDTALRRRFDFIPLLPNVDEGGPLAGLKIAAPNGQMIDIPQMLERINQRIEVLYDREHCIGHAYFTPLTNLSSDADPFAQLVHIFRNRIMPLLEEYFFEDWEKIQLVLGDNQKRNSDTKFIIKNHNQDLSDLFGNNQELDGYAKPHYQLQNSAFNEPEAYTGIYQLHEQAE